MFDAAFEPLDANECLALLGTVSYGRVAVVTEEGRPEIFPVNFVVVGKTVVFRTGSSVLLRRAPLGHIALEADVIDASSHEGWDVVVRGEGGDITTAIDAFSTQARSLHNEPWAPGNKDTWISIVKPHFSGRRLYVPTTAPIFG